MTIRSSSSSPIFRIETLALTVLAALAFAGCEARVNTPPSESNTTIVNPPSEKKVETNTTVVNPPPAEKKSE